MDGFNYYVEVKEIDNNTNHAILHFLFWSSKLDFSGSLNDIYLATLGKLTNSITLHRLTILIALYYSASACIGTYSTEAGILYNNRYPTVLTSSTTSSSSSSRKRDSRSNHSNTSTSSSSTATELILKNTKYPDDFFSKPKPTCIGSSSKRRRTSLDTTTIEPDLNLNLEHTNGHTKLTDAPTPATTNGKESSVESKVASVINNHNLLVNHSTSNGYLIPPFTTTTAALTEATAKGAEGVGGDIQGTDLGLTLSPIPSTTTSASNGSTESTASNGDNRTANNMRVTRRSTSSSPTKPVPNSLPATTTDAPTSVLHHTQSQHTLLPSSSSSSSTTPIPNATTGPVSLTSTSSSGVTSGTITGGGSGDAHTSTSTIDSHTRMFLTTLMMDKQCAHIRRVINMIQIHPQIITSIHNYTYTKSLNGQASGQIALKNTTSASTTSNITSNSTDNNDLNNDVKPSPATTPSTDNSNTTTTTSNTTAGNSNTATDTNSNDNEYITLTHTQWISLLNAKKHIDDLILKFLTPPN